MKPPPSTEDKRGNGEKLAMDQELHLQRKRNIRNKLASHFLRYSWLSQSHASSDVLTQCVRVTHWKNLIKKTKINRRFWSC